MEPKQKNFTVWYFVAAAVALMLVQALVLAPHVENLSYSEFKSLVAKGKVTNLVIAKQVISGTLAADGLEGLLPKEKLDELKRYGNGVHQFVTARVDDPALVADLEAALGWLIRISRGANRDLFTPLHLPELLAQQIGGMLLHINLLLKVESIPHFHELVGIACVAVLAGKLASAVRVDRPGEGHPRHRAAIQD